FHKNASDHSRLSIACRKLGMTRAGPDREARRGADARPGADVRKGAGGDRGRTGHGRRRADDVRGRGGDGRERAHDHRGRGGDGRERAHDHRGRGGDGRERAHDRQGRGGDDRGRAHDHRGETASAEAVTAEAGQAAPQERPRRRQARGERRIAQLLEAAASVFTTAGYTAASTNAIAREAGVSPGTLYQFFPNKEAIAIELGSRLMHEMRETYGDVLTPVDPATPLEQVVGAAVDRFIDRKSVV